MSVQITVSKTTISCCSVGNPSISVCTVVLSSFHSCTSVHCSVLYCIVLYGDCLEKYKGDETTSKFLILQVHGPGISNSIQRSSYSQSYPKSVHCITPLDCHTLSHK